MKPGPKPNTSGQNELLPRVFALAFGGFLALCLLKFGNPPILESFVTTPREPYEFIISSPWPILWAHWMFFVLAVLGVVTARAKAQLPVWLLLLPLCWLIWQCISAGAARDPHLSGAILSHFAICVTSFLLGVFSLSRAKDLGPFWLPVLGAFLIVLGIGWEQHFGGLEETRKYFFLYIYPTLPQVTPEYLKKMSSTRIFSTLFYPNTLAGALLLFLPPVVATSLRIRWLTPAARGLVVAVLCVGAMGCLYWSGSKAGWLLMLGLGVLALLRTELGSKLKLTLISGVLLLGVAGFLWKHVAFFEKGATSVGARFDYWEAAMRIARDHPLTGVGPGGFGAAYLEIKRPESEMTKLAHNDYLQQAADSGLAGALFYGAFIIGALVRTAPRWQRLEGRRGHLHLAADPMRAGIDSLPRVDADEWSYFAIWLGVFGWSLQSLFEFSLYIPPLAWAAFGLLGWMVAVRRRSPR
jgi:O-antigen ligase